jgi:hypothetical protein
MQSPEASTAVPTSRTQLHLALAGFADEVVGTLAHLLAYVGVLALFAILSPAALDRLPDVGDEEPGPQAGWTTADHSHPSSAINQLDSLKKTSAGRRGGIACPPNRPLRLNADNGPRPAESSAHAELNRGSCDPPDSDWLLGAANAQLRGTL